MRAKTFYRKFMLPISAGTMRLDADINSKCRGWKEIFNELIKPYSTARSNGIVSQSVLKMIRGEYIFKKIIFSGDLES